MGRNDKIDRLWSPVGVAQGMMRSMTDSPWCGVVLCVLGLAACGSKHPGRDDDGGIDGPADGTDAGSTRAPSCNGLAATCGASSNDSCCSSLEVPGGMYDRSYDLAGDASSGTTVFPATIGNFRLDKYEVTVGRFRAFVQAGMGTRANPPAAGAGAHTAIPGSGWDARWNTSLVASSTDLIAAEKCSAMFQTWTDTPGANETRPINCLTWYEAMAFCAWDGGYLATEAEWNYAAAGGDQQRAYPWSNPASSVSIDGSRASYSNGTDCVGDGMAGCALTDLVAVGTKPAGDARWAQSDLAGNVAEWTLDYAATYPTPCSDCTVLTATDVRTVRGGSYSEPVTNARTGNRGGLPPINRFPGVGVRCARAP